jgi:hypothetical protein
MNHAVLRGRLNELYKLDEPAYRQPACRQRQGRLYKLDELYKLDGALQT